ncbi:TetR/AcrR family transcriptional regulator [Paraburkholderia sp. CNPSo 3274]|uniref:TetR/AcrR family transcriptional regulator n=1 Tax=Paraburkholderia sp. CNPSo 3274 TaxID=2940932 RepID=UPI0020B70ACA|nr:TetR/AcrR family transcriptional regulator [Paraburkholderia sp. CNPSo 3274]MCP3708499.1 TetR/AcrR family transcriptional regulator [Paraburkholderia sp. CNPSo 3274]
MITRARTGAAAAPRPRGRRRAAADLDMREQLLASATQLFGEQGIAATTMAQIAEAAGVTSAMVHYYFTNREKLLDAVVEERIARSIAFVWESVDSAGGDLAQDPRALVEELVARLFDVTSRMPWLPPLWLREIVNEGGLLRERMLKRLPIEQLQRFAARVSEAQRDGSVNAELEAPLLFISILALVMLPLATSKIWQSARGFPKIEHEALHRHVSALLSAALRPAPQDERSRQTTGPTASRKGDAS